MSRQLRKTIVIGTLAPLWAGVAVAACSGDDGSAPPVGGDASSVDANVIQVESGVADSTTNDGAGNDGRSDAPADDASDAGDASDAPRGDSARDVEQPPPDADVCGSGWRTLGKECDDGLGANVDASVRRSCSAQCQVLDLLAHAPVDTDGGPPAAGRSLGAGRHPIAVTDSDAFAVTYVETQPSVRLSLTSFGRRGVASDVVTTFSNGSMPTADSNPVIAGFPGGRFVVAYGELGGDGDELGIALRVVTPGTTPSGAPMFANQGTAFNQHDPDVLFAGGQIVVAWVDDSNVATAPDLRFRTFDSNLSPTSSDHTLAATAHADTSVALAPFGASWAAAWREIDGSSETLRVIAGNAAWSLGPFATGPSGDKPALAQVDSTHMLVVFSVGGAAGSKLQGAVVDTGAPGAVAPFDMPGTVAATLAQSEANVVTVGTRVFVAWKTERAAPDSQGLAEELWLKAVGWNGAAVDMGTAEIALPRWGAHRAGDQRRAAMAASGLPAEGAVVSAWEDVGAAFGAGEGAGDVAVELVPVPWVRAVNDGGAQ